MLFENWSSLKAATLRRLGIGFGPRKGHPSATQASIWISGLFATETKKGRVGVCGTDRAHG
jgi:hypothetical protein